MDEWSDLAAGLAAGAASLALACGSPAGQQPTPIGTTPEPSPSLAAPTAPLTPIANRNWGFVAPDPANPRYLQLGGASGRPFQISSYGTLVGCAFTGDEARRLKERGARYAVVWHQWSGCSVEPNWLVAPWTGPWRLACDPRDALQRAKCPDHPLWDLSQFDEEYWKRLEAVVAAADDGNDGTGKRLVVRVHLFARQEFGAGREQNPFRGINNVNGVRAYDDPSRDPDLRYFVKATSWCAVEQCDDPAKSLFASQQAYVRKLLDATHAHGNVVYEIMNEPPVSDDPGSGSAQAFAYFAEYWSWFVKDYLASHYGVARLVEQDEQNNAFGIANIDVADARWGGHASNLDEEGFLNDVLGGLTSALRTSYLSHGKVTTVDEFGNAEVDPSRLRREAWAIVTSGGHFHVEDACDPQARVCPNPPEDEGGEPDPTLDARPWDAVRSIEAFKAASGWRFDRARPAHRDGLFSVRWFYWMVQDGPPFDTVGFAAAGTQDHVGYLAHHPSRACYSEPLPSDLPGVPSGASEYVARLWDPAGTDYVKDPAGKPLEYRFTWGGGAFDWCRTPLAEAMLKADDVVVHVHAGRATTAAADPPAR